MSQKKNSKKIKTVEKPSSAMNNESEKHSLPPIGKTPEFLPPS